MLTEPKESLLSPEDLNEMMEGISFIEKYTSGDFIAKDGRRYIKVIRLSEDGFKAYRQSVDVYNPEKADEPEYDEEGYKTIVKGCFCFCRLLDTGAYLGLHKEGFNYTNVTYLDADTIIYVQDYELDFFSNMEKSHLDYDFVEMTIGDYHDKYVKKNWIKTDYYNYERLDGEWYENDGVMHHESIESYRLCEFIMPEEICDKISTGEIMSISYKCDSFSLHFEEHKNFIYLLGKAVLDKMPPNDLLTYLTVNHGYQYNFGCGLGTIFSVSVDYDNETYSIVEPSIFRTDRDKLLEKYNLDTSYFKSLVDSVMSVIGYTYVGTLDEGNQDLKISTDFRVRD